jgi:hypothetical protein
MEKIDSLRLSDTLLIERRRREAELREADFPVCQVAEQCQLSTRTVVESYMASRHSVGGVKRNQVCSYRPERQQKRRDNWEAKEGQQRALYAYRKRVRANYG